ncbi:4-(cytidine 5'-diphospho)-2-C-methyl-D-erythritol kinase [Entomospira culicis]|uniref:4-(cytidine 5'-diphospho)-2-C-methyl-D-erythritol kinase n=1 Tax=Entomospira culicis TaxID=2719989 RepID=UPI002367C0AA|nr:4-(cytidine 5'-diphospho)-2-C-methyl-D-erythritol kinase [Entomospira culicis]WDI37968.1 4-(cytidine 5'-diphospho)-2-C-methyl-D-erythritol kinase [Entomospira culicis]WDI39591.1 4-(cytidine 5'-diphospho)-2-C-methyl-D-erythritol kinase [Entomospira culicis]
MVAPAKLNLHLEVLGKDPERTGYHQLRSLMVKIDLYDRLDLTIDLHNNNYQLQGFAIAPEQDILYKSYQLFRELSGINFGLDLQLTKKIPQQAGLGGGSADAGALLQFLQKYFNYPLPLETLIRASASIGADIPFFVQSASVALVEGIGERITPLTSPSTPLVFLLIKPNEAMPTAQAFRTLSKEISTKRATLSAEQLRDLWEDHPINETHPHFFNHFIEALTDDFPQTRSILHALRTHTDVQWASMSGSGTTLFARIKDSQRARQLQQEYQDKGFFSQIVTTLG